MNRITGALLAGAIGGAAIAVSVLPAAAQSASELGRSLTPFGAIKAGNAEGTIPAWTGGVVAPPAGYSPGDHHPDPFAADRVQFTINAGNAAEFADRLTAGHVAMLQQYPSFSMNVYPTRRSASAPQRIYDASIANASSARLIEDGNGVAGASVGIPFPIPENGLEAIWNHLLRYRGETVHRRYGQANPTAGGSYTMVKIDENILFPYAMGDTGNISVLFRQEVKAPARLAGEILLVHETINQIAEPRQAWTYNPGQRRVRRAPNIAYDNPGTAADGLRTSDNLDIFNGAPDRYTWELLGRREMYVPYNAYKLHSDALEYDDIIRPGHLNPEHLRYELHRVWVVDARLREGTSHIYARRTFYLDEDSWQIVAVDHYDSRGQMWRVGEAHGINYYDLPTYWTTLHAIYDLQAGRYTANGFDNQEQMYEFTVSLSARDFTPNALRRAGRR